MGSVTLKKKKQLNYRKGPASGGCSQCNHYDMIEMPGVQDRNGVVWESRCRVMGLKLGRAYRINPDNICDRFDNSRHIARLTGALA